MGKHPPHPPPPPPKPPRQKPQAPPRHAALAAARRTPRFRSADIRPQVSAIPQTQFPPAAEIAIGAGLHSRENPPATQPPQSPNSPAHPVARHHEQSPAESVRTPLPPSPPHKLHPAP